VVKFYQFAIVIQKEVSNESIWRHNMNPIPNHCIECDKPTMDILCDKCKEDKDSLEEKDEQD